MNTNSVIVKSNKYGLIVILDEKLPFEELLVDIKDKFRESAKFFKNAKMALTIRGRQLNLTEEKKVVEAIVESCGLHILCVIDESRENEAYYKRAVDEALAEKEKQDGLFYRGTLKAGQILETEQSVVILGDVQAGANIIAKGNIVVLGALRGIAYAGASGDPGCFVAALIMKPIQVRIADKLARSAITKRSDTTAYEIEPKIAYIKEEHLLVKDITQESLQELTF